MDPTGIPIFLFFVVMALAVSGWLALIFFPRKPWANFWYAGVIVPLALSFLYMYLLLTFWNLPPAANFLQFRNLPGVSAMLQNLGLLLVAWINLIMMDLVAGAWMTRKAVATKMPTVYLVPCLVLTFVFAGFGFALFALVTALGNRWKEIARIELPPPVESEPVSVQVPPEIVPNR